MQSKSQKKAINKAEKRERKRKRQAEFRASIFKRDGGRCFWCKKELFLVREGVDLTNVPKKIRATLDHVQPRSKGGSNRKSNLVTCCPSCNQRRENHLVNPVTGYQISPSVISCFLS